MTDYDKVREQYKPDYIRVLMIAESQPPAAGVASSRQFYRTDTIYREDRLFTNTIRAIYPEAAEIPEADLKMEKQKWLHRFSQDGWYMTEALETSLAHEVTKQERQERIRNALPHLIERVKELATPDTRIILIKSNVFEVAAEPLRSAGYNVVNNALLDYPGRFNQKAYREKLTKMIM
jgi:predicted ATP-dependent endonuclease of OLD family